ncbi:hypothetical protein [Streptomyces erythrochromogenes]|uniref:hypothetical protein n=1 Tax=Streptomyces erythrochromogenes TaxID=285574 RepID=UPI00344650B0
MTDLLAPFIVWCAISALAGLVLGCLGYRANRHKDAATAPDRGGRHTASTITDDALDALYDRIDYLAGSTAALETYAAEQRERAEQAGAELAAFHEGEEPQPDWRATSTPAQWIWLWNRATLEQRLDVAARFAANGATAQECVLMNHRATVEEVRRIRAAVARVRAAHPETADGRCGDCLVPWPCPDICRLDGPPGCRNCGEYHTPITDRPQGL